MAIGTIRSFFRALEKRNTHRQEKVESLAKRWSEKLTHIMVVMNYGDLNEE